MTDLDRRQDRAPVPSDWTYAPAPEARDIVSIEDRYGLYVGGEWLEPRSGEHYTTISPASEEPLAEIAQAGPEDVALAVDAAREAYENGWSALGPAWMTPDLFRFGASSLLNDVLMQIRKQKTGRYQSADYFTID